MFLLELLVVFLVAVVLDGLNTLYVRWVAERAVWRATVVSGVVTLLASAVFVRIATQAEGGEQAGSLLVYALGSSAGTWLGMGGRREALPLTPSTPG